MITIRNARLDDAGLLAEIGLRAWEKAMIPVGETAGMVESARSAFQNFTQNGWISISVIEKAGMAAGWAAREQLDEVITDFWIAPDSQRQGLGSVLLEKIEADIKDRGFTEARVETHAMNEEAVSFFAKHGYTVRWLTVAYNPKLDRDIQSIGMSRQLVEAVPTAYGQEF